MPINLSNEQFQNRLNKYICPSNAPTTDTHLDVFVKILRRYNWRVAVMAGSFNWAHREKFFFMDEILREENTGPRWHASPKSVSTSKTPK